jgi:tetratricopeptide (TPR) repeat protein
MRYPSAFRTRPIKRQGSPSPSIPQVGWVPWLQAKGNAIRKLAVEAIILGTITIGLFLFGRELRSDQYVVESFTLPKEISDLGFSGEVASQRLWAELRNIIEENRSYKNAFRFTHVGERVDIALPDGALSSQALVRMIRRFFGLVDRRIAGEVVCGQGSCLNDSVALRIRVIDETVQFMEFKVRPIKRGDVITSPALAAAPGVQPLDAEVAIQDVFNRAAIAVMEVVDPYRAAIYLRERRPGQARRIAERMVFRGDADQAWGFMFLGNYEWQINGDLAAAVERYRQSIAIDPAFGFGHAMLASALIARRGPGDLNEAEAFVENGRRLMKGAPFPEIVNSALLVARRADRDQVIGLLRRVVATHPADPTARIALARQLFRESSSVQGSQENAELLDAFRTVTAAFTDEKPNALHIFNICEISIKANVGVTPPMCLELFEHLSRKWPFDMTYRYQKSRFLGLQMNDWKTALFEAKRVIAESPSRTYLLAFIVNEIDRNNGRREHPTVLCEAADLLRGHIDWLKPPDWMRFYPRLRHGVIIDDCFK